MRRNGASENGKQTRLYMVWHQMKRRCQDPKNKSWENYGGRGITVCEEWLSFHEFSKWANAAGYKPGLTIERKNNNLGYCPDNCGWIPKSQQGLNRTSNRIFGGVCMAEFCRRNSIPYDRMKSRLKRGMPLLRAMKALDLRFK